MIIEKKLLPLQPFEIPVKGLKSGRSTFQWHADGDLFSIFGNTEILKADLNVEITVDYDGYSIEVEGKIDGDVTVACDRCLEDLVIPVHTSFEDDEFDGVVAIDLKQDVYDFVCISLPMHRVHNDGGCNEETVKYLNK